MAYLSRNFSLSDKWFWKQVFCKSSLQLKISWWSSCLLQETIGNAICSALRGTSALPDECSSQLAFGSPIHFSSDPDHSTGYLQAEIRLNQEHPHCTTVHSASSWSSWELALLGVALLWRCPYSLYFLTSQTPLTPGTTASSLWLGPLPGSKQSFRNNSSQAVHCPLPGVCQILDGWQGKPGPPSASPYIRLQMSSLLLGQD